MKSNQVVLGTCLAVAVSAAIVAGCGGGGGSSTLPPGPQPSPTVSPSAPPGPSPTPILAATTMLAAKGGTYPGPYTYATAASDTVVFGCGCTDQAGLATTDASGSFTAQSPVTATPAVPNPMYTMVPGRNYVVVAEVPTTLVGPQGWTILFAGNSPTTTLGLGDAGSVVGAAASSDVFTTAAALYVYEFSTQGGPGKQAFDDWNFNTIQSWVQVLVNTPNTAEKTLLNDIAAAGGNKRSLFPAAPKWNPTQPTNGKISADLGAVKSSLDPAIPTPCPGGPSGCTGTPVP